MFAKVWSRREAEERRSKVINGYRSTIAFGILEPQEIHTILRIDRPMSRDFREFVRVIKGEIINQGRQRVIRSVPIHGTAACINASIVITSGKSMDQTDMVANPARGQLYRETYFFSVTFSA